MGVLTAWMVLAAAGLPAAGVDFDGPRIEVRLQSPGGMLVKGDTPQLAWGQLTLDAQDRVQAPQLTYGDTGTLEARIRSGEDTYELKLVQAGFPPVAGKKPVAKAPARTEGGVAVEEGEEALDTVTLRGLAELKHNGKVVAPQARVLVRADRGRGPALRVVVDGLPRKQFPGGSLEARFDDVLIAKAGEAAPGAKQAQAPAATGTGGSGDAKAKPADAEAAKAPQDGQKRDARAEAEQQGREEGEGWIREARPGESGVLSVMEFDALEEDRRQQRRSGDARTTERSGTAGTGGGAAEGTGAPAAAQPGTPPWVDPYGSAPVATSTPVDALDGAVGGAGSALIDSSDRTPVAAGGTVAVPQGNGPGIGGGGLPQGSGNVNGREAATHGAFPGLSSGPQGVSPGFGNGLREVPEAGFDDADGVGGEIGSRFPTPGLGPDAPSTGSAQARALSSTTRPLDPRLAPIDFSVAPGQSTVASGGTIDSDRPVGSVGVPGAAAMSPGSPSDLGIANGAQVAPGIPGSPAPLNNGRFPEALLNMSGIATGLPGTPAPLNDGRFPLGPQGLAPSASGVDTQSSAAGNGASGSGADAVSGGGASTVGSGVNGTSNTLGTGAP